MENEGIRKMIVQNVIKTLDQLELNYNKSKEYLDFMIPIYHPNTQMYDGITRDFYIVSFFMEYNPDFGETQIFGAYVDASTLKLISIGIAHGNLEVVYDKSGKAIKTKFISPSFPYEKQ